MESNSTAILIKIKLRHSLGRPSRSDFVQAEFVETMLHRKLGKMDILVDDHTPNLTRWETAGGTGVKWLNGINGKNGRFEGIRVGRVEELKAAFDEIADRK